MSLRITSQPELRLYNDIIVESFHRELYNLYEEGRSIGIVCLVHQHPRHHMPLMIISQHTLRLHNSVVAQLFHS